MTLSTFSPLELDTKKSGGGSPRGDKHKTNQPERRPLPFWVTWLYDLEPLAAGAGPI